MRALQIVAKMLGCHEDDADAAMRSERGYRAAMSRRSLLAAGAALAVGRTLFEGVGLPEINPWDRWEGALDDDCVAVMVRAMGAIASYKGKHAQVLPPDWTPIDLRAHLEFVP